MVIPSGKLVPLCSFVILLTYGCAFTIHAQPQKEVNLDSLQSTLTLSELLTKAQELNRNTLATIAQLQDTTELHAFRIETHELIQSVTEVKEESDLFLKSYSREWLIRNLEAKWARIKNKNEKLNNSLTEAIQKNEKELLTIQELNKTWTTTRSEILQNKLGESLRKPISDLLLNLREEEKILNQTIRIYLGLQQKVTTSSAIITSYQEAIKPLLNQDFLSLLTRNETLLWDRHRSADSVQLKRQLQRSYQLSSYDAVEYLKINTGRLVLVLVITLGIVLVIRSAKKTIKQNSITETDQLAIIKPLENIWVYIYTVIIMLTLLVFPAKPPLVLEVLLLLFTYPLIVFVIAKASGIIRYVTTGFLVLYWSYKLTNFFIIDNLLTSYIDLIHSIAAALLLIILFRKKQEFRNQFPELYSMFKGSFIPIMLILTCLAVILQIIGFSLLARTLTTGAISYGYLAPVILISGLISFNTFKALELNPFIKNSVLARNYYHFIYSGIRVVTIYLLFTTIITAYSLKPTALALLQEIWNFGGQFGEFSITLGGVLEFFLIIIIAVVISGMIQVIVEGEILSRMNLSRGVAMAIGVMARYSIVVLGFLLAVASSGFDLTKISIIAGAVGVGIGFGLQNLVANFMAGLILIFERPFVVDDTIESEQVEGTVKQIGIRASKILTYDGAEVIIPNSNLISNRVSNWTLTSNSRRQLIIVRTSMQADPDQVIDVLYQIVRRHENILTDPEPFVLFDGQLEQSLQFKLYYWVMSDLFKTRSDLNLQIYRELKTMGVELPIPIHTIQSKEDIRIEKS